MSIYQDSNRHLWVGADNEGIFELDAEGKRLRHYQPGNNPRSMANTIMCMYEDTNGDFWLGTYTRGLAKLNRRTGECEYPLPVDNEKIFSITEDRHKNLYIATFGSGFYQYNLVTKELKHYESSKDETGDLTTYYKGMEIGEIWGFRTAGIYASNADALNGPAYNFFKNGEMFRAYAGDLRFVDVDGDGIMTKGNRTLSNHGDLEIIGNQSPRYQYSINMSLNWNGIGLSMLWQGVGKRDWYPWTESGFFWGKWNRAYNSLMKTQTGDNVVRIDKSTDNWRVTNMDKNPYWTRMVSLAANRNDGPLTWENDHYLQDASYIRLKNITIDYTFPKHICKKLRLEGLKVYLSGENLFTHSPMFKHTDMFDPEVITSGDSDFAASTTSGLNGTGNGYSYPMLKTVTLGINVTF